MTALRLMTAFAALGILVPGLAFGGELDDACALLLSGKYAEAADAYSGLIEKEPVEATIGLARARASTGQREAAEKALRSAIEKHDDSAALHAELALLLFERAALAEAQQAADAALKRQSDQFAARWIVAELHQSAGRLKEAEQAYGSLVEQAAKIKKRDDRDAWLWIGRAAAQQARWKRNSQQFRVLVNDHFARALEQQPQDWRIHFETARLFAEKYNEAAATAEINAGLALNPSAAPLHLLRAELALQNFHLKQAQASLERVLRIDPESAAALRLQGDVALAEVDAARALERFEAAREINPADEETLGRIAAAYLALDGSRLDDRDSRAGRLMTEVERRNEHCGRFYMALGEAFELLRRYPQSAHYYQEARRRMPQLLYVEGRLGLVRMRLGEEAEARQLLTSSFRDDPFNVRVKNMLEVLDVLDTYALLETEHFLLRFDRGKDELLARYAARYLEEEVYPEIVKTLGYEPEGKSLFEIFNRAKNTSGHGWFSARMVGLPFVGTVGACAGKVVAMASPTDMPERFHWGQVLKHEFVHVVNLQQTDFNIPHWFTEGLAVRLEAGPRPPGWDDVLARRHAAGTLLNLDNINLAFIRPANSQEWALAYCQAELYCEYLVKTYGDDALARMLAAYRDNLTTAAALQREFHVAQDEFERGYAAYVAEIVRELGLRTDEEEASVVELERAVEGNPRDARLHARLALAHLTADSVPAARKAALAAQEIDAKEPLAGYVLARIAVSIGDHESALKTLAPLHRDDAPDERIVGLLAALRFQQGDYAAAEKLYRLGQRHFAPRDKWLKALAKVYLKTGDDEQLAPVLEELAARETNSATLRKKLAQLAQARKDWPAVERWTRDALFIELDDAALHGQLAEALAQQQKWKDAIFEYEVALQLEPLTNAWRLALAEAHLRAGDKPSARNVVKELIERSPDYPGAATLLEQTNP